MSVCHCLVLSHCLPCPRPSDSLPCIYQTFCPHSLPINSTQYSCIYPILPTLSHSLTQCHPTAFTLFKTTTHPHLTHSLTLGQIYPISPYSHNTSIPTPVLFMLTHTPSHLPNPIPTLTHTSTPHSLSSTQPHTHTYSHILLFPYQHTHTYQPHNVLVYLHSLPLTYSVTCIPTHGCLF